MGIWSFNRDRHAVLGDALAAAYPQGPIPVQRRDRDGAHLTAWAGLANSNRMGLAAISACESSMAA